MDFPLNTLGVSHKFMADNIKKGALCIDATCGKGRDTAFLCELAGKEGRVLAFDIQDRAVLQTKALLKEKGFENAEVFLDNHKNIGSYVKEGTVDAIMFNLGWLPGGDHNIFSRPESSVPAIEASLKALKKGGVMSICIYHGKECGTLERDALLEYLKTVDNKLYTVMILDFYNRTGDIPIPVLIVKE
jgi:16S rRNA C1402 N4-methylase RsmH